MVEENSDLTRVPKQSHLGMSIRTLDTKSMPRRSLPSDEIICGFHGGFHTRSTLASEIAGIVGSFCFAPIAIDAPIDWPSGRPDRVDRRGGSGCRAWISRSLRSVRRRRLGGEISDRGRVFKRASQLSGSGFCTVIKRALSALSK